MGAWLKVILLIVAIIFSSCMGEKKIKSKSKSISYNKSAQGWYDAISKSLSEGNLELADKQFISLRSEHMDSSLLPTLMLILAQAHMAKEEYLLANYYLDEYIKKYAYGKDAEYARFLKLKASFLGIKDINKNQKLVEDTLKLCKEFYNSYPDSTYKPLVQTMIVRLEMAEHILNRDIAKLYKKLGKERAYKLYQDRANKFKYSSDEITMPANGFVSSLNPFN